jgi:hypothetical protein
VRLTSAPPQVTSSPTRLARAVSCVLGEWYLRLALERHTRAWALALLLSSITGVVGVAVIALLGAKGGQSEVRLFAYIVCSTIYACVFLGIPVFDSRIVGLIWRQVVPLCRGAARAVGVTRVSCAKFDTVYLVLHILTYIATTVAGQINTEEDMVCARARARTAVAAAGMNAPLSADEARAPRAPAAG